VKKKLLFGVTALMLVALIVPLITACPAEITKDKLVFGAARPISGALSGFEQYSFGPMYKLWAQDVNAAGGITVGGKKLPIELKVYDDTSDLGTSTQLIEKLILVDKVDFLLPNCSTAFLYASAPLANKYGYIYLGGEGGATTLTAMMPDLPYFFGCLNYSDYYQIPPLVEALADKGVETAAIIYINDLHGVEYYLVALSEFTRVGIEVVSAEAVPVFATDVELELKAARDSGADILCAFVYPPTTMSVVGQSLAICYNPKAMILGPGGNFEFFKDIFGEAAMEGIISFGAWSRESSPELDAFADHLVDYYGAAGEAAFGDPEAFIDWWGADLYYAGLQCLQQAIEKANSLDQKKIRDVLASEHFTTILGDTWFDMTANGAGGGLLSKDCHSGEIGQWQSGVFEVICPSDKMTTDTIIYPR